MVFDVVSLVRCAWTCYVNGRSMCCSVLGKLHICDEPDGQLSCWVSAFCVFFTYIACPGLYGCVFACRSWI